MTIYYLYIKTHNITGLKYLGQTSKQDPYLYCGSGKHWVTHLKEYGFNVRTEILSVCISKQELSATGRYYSEYYKILSAVDNYGNRIWANKIPETGGGGTPTSETRKKLSVSQLGRVKPTRTLEHKENLSLASKGVPKPRSIEHQAALSNAIKTNWQLNDESRAKTAAVGKANLGRKQSFQTLEKRRQAMVKYWDIKLNRGV